MQAVETSASSAATVRCSSLIMRPSIVACGWSVGKKVWRGLRSFPHRLVCEAERQLSCRVYEQDGKLARVHRQDREKKEADNEADQGCSVTPPKDEEPIPSTHCDTRNIVSTASFTHAWSIWSTATRRRCMIGLHVTKTVVQDSGLITSPDHVV